MKLNRTGSNWTGLERNKINENWSIIEGSYNDVVENVSEKAFEQVVDSAKLDWKEPVDSFNDLPSSASEGEARMVRDTGKVYRYNGSAWVEIQQIDAGPVNELDTRLTQQLADTDYYRSKESMINRKQRKPMIWWIDDDGRKGVYTKLKTLAQEYGVSFTSAIITKNWNKDPNKYLTPAEIKELSDDYGFEFISHTHNHDPNHRPYQMTDEELHEDFSTSQKIMRDNGLNYRGFFFPFGASSGEERIKNIARQYFDFAVGTGASGSTSDNSGPAQVPSIDMYYIRRTTVERVFDI